MTSRGASVAPASYAAANLRPQFVPVPRRMSDTLPPEVQLGRLTTSCTTDFTSANVYHVLAFQLTFDEWLTRAVVRAVRCDGRLPEENAALFPVASPAT